MQSVQSIPVLNGYALFWGQWPSNWEPSPMTIDAIQYGCVEQYMMAEKARVFEDMSTWAKIMNASDPKEQKSLGRQVRGFNEQKWAEVRYEIVLKGTLEKYRQNQHLLERLLAVPDEITFVEASPEDKVWGIGMRRSDPRAVDPSQWRGLNLLGKAVTEARTILRKESQNAV